MARGGREVYLSILLTGSASLPMSEMANHLSQEGLPMEGEAQPPAPGAVQPNPHAACRNSGPTPWHRLPSGSLQHGHGADSNNRASDPAPATCRAVPLPSHSHPTSSGLILEGLGSRHGMASSPFRGLQAMVNMLTRMHPLPGPGESLPPSSPQGWAVHSLHMQDWPWAGPAALRLPLSSAPSLRALIFWPLHTLLLFCIFFF